MAPVRKKCTGQEPQVRAGQSGLPCAMVLTVSFELSPVTGLSCHRHPRDAKASREFSASVGAPGPHDFAVRDSIIRLVIYRVHRIPLPTSVTIVKRPNGTGEGSD